MTQKRLVVLDVLRGLALLLIIIRHFIEHFGLFTPPDTTLVEFEQVDKQIVGLSYLLISGKAYSVFALLFGLSFYIQVHKKEQVGIDYRFRFLWRMMILLIIGFFHSLIYKGDILHIYALLSLPVLALYKANTRYLWIIVCLLFMQIPILYQIMRTFISPDYEFVTPFSGISTSGAKVYSTGTLGEVVQYNLWRGRISLWAWTLYNGRLFQLLMLFFVGIILGRKGVFVNIKAKSRGFTVALLLSIGLVFLLRMLIRELSTLELTALQQDLFYTLLTSYNNLIVTTGYISMATLLYIKFSNAYITKLFAAYGKMSLTNYVTQAILGVFVFYGFGLGMYHYLGPTLSLLLGIIVFVSQLLFSKIWSSRFVYGPLEWFWRCATSMDFSVPLKQSIYLSKA